MHFIEWMKRRGPIRKPISNERLAEISEAGRQKLWTCSKPGVSWTELELMANEIIQHRKGALMFNASELVSLSASHGEVPSCNDVDKLNQWLVKKDIPLYVSFEQDADGWKIKFEVRE